MTAYIKNNVNQLFQRIDFFLSKKLSTTQFMSHKLKILDCRVATLLAVTVFFEAGLLPVSNKHKKARCIRGIDAPGCKLKNYFLQIFQKFRSGFCVIKRALDIKSNSERLNFRVRNRQIQHGFCSTLWCFEIQLLQGFIRCAE